MTRSGSKLPTALRQRPPNPRARHIIGWDHGNGGSHARLRRGSFILANVAAPATIDNFVFDSTAGGGRSTVLLPYIEQHEEETNDGGFVINWTTGDGPKDGNSVGVIAIIAPRNTTTGHRMDLLHWRRPQRARDVESFPNQLSEPKRTR
jgi:hypothetical protein